MTAQVSSSATQDVEATHCEILAEVRNHIGHLTLNRPGGLNAINLNMVRALQRHLDAWSSDPAIKVVVLRGAGEKAFCAGGDIRSPVSTSAMVWLDEGLVAVELVFSSWATTPDRNLSAIVESLALAPTSPPPSETVATWRELLVFVTLYLRKQAYYRARGGEWVQLLAEPYFYVCRTLFQAPMSRALYPVTLSLERRTTSIFQ